MSAWFSSVTSPPLPPSPPEPPRPSVEDLPLLEPATVMAKPPSPPPPPTLWASTPTALAPRVVMWPKRVANTLWPSEPAPPAPAPTLESASVVGQRQSARETAGPAAAADRLDQHGGRARAFGAQVAMRGDADLAGVVARAAVAARVVGVRAAVQRQRTADGKAARAAAAAHRLGEDRVRQVAVGGDVAGVGHLDVVGVVAAAAVAADRLGRGVGFLGRDRRGHREAGVAAAAAHALGLDAVGVGAGGLDLAGVGDRDLARIVARAAVAAGGVVGRVAAGREARRHGPAAGAAAAADGLSQDAVGAVAGGDHRVARDGLGHGRVGDDRHVAGEVARAADAAHRVDGVGPLLGQGGADRPAAAAAAAAHALGEDAVGQGAGRVDRAVAGDVDRGGIAAVAALPPRTAARRRSHRQRSLVAEAVAFGRGAE